jgi:hypothetical protein
VTVEFDPVRLSGRSWRRELGAVLVLVAAVLLVVVAVAKPWGSEADVKVAEANASPSPTPLTSPTAPPAPAAHAGIRLGEPAARWEHVEEAMKPHDTWGVRAFVDRKVIDGLARPRAARLHERWEPAPGEPTDPGEVGPGGQTATAVAMPTADEPVRVIGVTTPGGVTIRGARVWWIRAGQPARWVAAETIPGSGGQLMLLPPIRLDGTGATWPTGTYRLDLLLEEGIARLTLVLPASAARPDPPEGRDPFAPLPPDPGRRPGPLGLKVEHIPAGPFLVTDAGLLGIDAPSFGEVMGEEAAWSATAHRPEDQRVIEYATGATAIGFGLPGDAVLEDVSLLHLSPAAGAGRTILRSALRRTDGTAAAVVFRSTAATLPAGSYALVATWSQQGDVITAVWHATLLPGGTWTRAGG